MRNKLLNQAMKKKLRLAVAILTIVGGSSLFVQNALVAQNTLEGGGGVIHLNGNPNLNASLVDVSINEAHVALDTLGMIVYFYDATGAAYDVAAPLVPGTQWLAVDVNAANTTVSGAGDISVTLTGADYEVSFSETHTTLTWNAATNELTYNSEDGAPTVLDLSGSVDFDDSNSINVAGGTGTAADPYSFIIDGSDTATVGEMPVSDGAGGLTWETVVQSATFLATGELQLTLTDGSFVNVDMTNVPTVSDMADLNAKAAAVAATGGIAKAAVKNTFGMPATANGAVLFLIQN
ncbi:MAG: hypothetical protein ACI8YQ_002785 [Polaribacter sp.]|jgi:hypothetical protein